LDRFDALILKMILKNEKHHFDIFQHEKHFEKQPQSYSQTGPKSISLQSYQPT
jgi:hypothetical protein